MNGKKIYQKIDVYQAVQKRLKTIFDTFDNIYVSFSGGKDSGLLLNLCIQYMRKHGITKKIGVFHQDFEAQYTETTNYVERMMTSNPDLIEPYWVCMPMTVDVSTSAFQKYWIPWNPAEKDIWVREMPTHPCVINLDNHKFDFYKQAMLEGNLYAGFSPWYHNHVCGGQGKTICLVGIRTDESLNRFRAIVRADKGMHPGLHWTTKMGEDIYSGYPLYDWGVEDVWTANAKFEFDYNKLYDLFYYAGASIHEMRVASPFLSFGTNSLKLYRAIEPNVWAKLLGRVQGCNFTSIYAGTGAMGWKNIKLPPNHTWKSYLDLLLSTLPEDTRKNYEEKFTTSIDFWFKKGGVLSTETIDELKGLGINITLQGKSNYKSDKQRVTFEDYPDDLDVKEFQSVPSYKRMAICILKNDHLCKYMGFSQTKAETEKRKAAMEKYKNL